MVPVLYHGWLYRRDQKNTQSLISGKEWRGCLSLSISLPLSGTYCTCSLPSLLHPENSKCIMSMTIIIIPCMNSWLIYPKANFIAPRLSFYNSWDNSWVQHELKFCHHLLKLNVHLNFVLWNTREDNLKNVLCPKVQ